MEISNSKLGQLFSPSTLRKLIDDPTMPFITRLKQTQNAPIPNKKLFDEAYALMAKQYRNEYFFKNTLLNKILLGRHSIRTSTAIRELPVAGSILDFLIINGVGQVYEIKTKLDNLKRLSSQLSSYYKAFKYVSVVTDNSHAEVLYEQLQGTDVGLVVLTPRQTLSTLIEPKEHLADLNQAVMFKILRKSEYETALLDYFHVLPDVSQFEYYRTCLKWFEEIDVEICHQYLLRALKTRNNVRKHEKAFNNVPTSIKELVYFQDYSQAEYQQLFTMLDQE
ncbi:sce7726 family protein [Lacticaseibacillus casei]|jgi:hypothetical protein|uniref:Sce7726 family protein n=1 Tax=Lacticaseibacillus huelsenbergensis TaxID=3035291 RepID=A0ABY8DTA3_9LACO|nr:MULTISPECIES: sce7726 family protein [Lacticaseibacillus]MDG3063066.1 sce7726 family protein [Lacticaseibacillus sp. BCRC 81376]MDN4553523.1 sce7726 family protein [Lacticaseibacillus paracasei]QVI36501.1 sce7726 family protein [Lacticaseibacillus casei]QXG58294.1 sce7726 family protein [Lacticaseibacillus casei]WFB40246.1 sce7726 family protein [Lacticaseibacillus huelsenbergensis]